MISGDNMEQIKEHEALRQGAATYKKVAEIKLDNPI